MGSAARILVVEDRDSLRRLLERALAGEGYAVTAAASGGEGVRAVREAPIDLVLTDLKLPDLSGLEVLAASRAAQPRAPVVVLTAYGTVAAAVEAMKLGAHPRLRAALRLLERVAPTESTVLLTGESGTGKELFARALHGLSPRRAGPFVALNCAAIPETLLENELFGHERGAFTGADRRQPGRFELAQGGTLLLDEIGELPLAVQSKVLRALEERTFERVGGGRTLRADVRLVAATNRDLKAMVDTGQFRSDLYFRLEVFPIELPPLRERPSDVPLLARHLLAEIARRHRREPPALDEEAAELLSAQPWPGNVRELANLLERAVILCDGPVVRGADLKPLLEPPGGERERLRQALVEAGGDKRRAADLAGLSYRAFLQKVRAHDLEGVPRYRDG